MSENRDKIRETPSPIWSILFSGISTNIVRIIINLKGSNEYIIKYKITPELSYAKGENTDSDSQTSTANNS